MATYKLIPSSLTGRSMQNASNAYTDTDSTTYAEIDFASGQQDYYLGGFVSLPPVENVTSVVIKLKACLFSSGSSYGLQATLLSAPNGIALSDTITISSTTATAYTFTLTASAETVASYADTLCLHLYNVGGIHKVYGADITIEADLKIFNNKIIYGNETLIDLTGDTATEADVASGKTFHLANGIQSTGILSPSPSVATATTSSSTAKTVSFTVSKEPSWFLLICAKGANTRTYRVHYCLYNGSNTQVGSAYYGSTVGMVLKETDPQYVTWAYSANTLTFTIYEYASNYYFGTADWELYYL